MRLPQALKNLILKYHAELLHTQRLERCHCELFIRAYFIKRPRRVLSVSYWLSLE